MTIYSIKVFLSISIFLVFTGCGLFESEANSKINLLGNSDIEFNNVVSPTNWDAYAEDDYIAEWTTEESTSPTHSLKISSTVPNYGKDAYWAQSPYNSLVFDKKMILRLKVKVENVVGRGIYFRVHGRGESGSYESITNTDYVLNITGTHDWQEYQIEVEEFPSTVIYANVFLMYGRGTTGTVYFDDVYLEY